MNLGLYVHIPFCQQKCFYCDFPSYANLDYLYGDYITALCRELSRQGGNLSEAVVDTVYIGGGTPTVLSDKMLAQLVDCIYDSFTVSNDAEISIEANPGTVDKNKLMVLRQNGVNRISFGVQSFADELLKSIGRIHTADDALYTIGLAQEAGFTNINIDLMYGLPKQAVNQLTASITKAAELGVQHISVYGLKIEDDTVFAELWDQGLLDLPAEDTDAAMYELVAHILPEYGYKRYEISNFSQTGYECRHNLKYWQYRPYLGVGAAAHSFLYPQRKANLCYVADYIKGVTAGQLPLEFCEQIDLKTAMAEFAFLALRTTQGLALSEFKRCFNSDFFDIYRHIIYKLEQQNLIVIADRYIRLTDLGMKYGNVVFSQFLI